eukprot:2919837-Rhodomonas_salina.1
MASALDPTPPCLTLHCPDMGHSTQPKLPQHGTLHTAQAAGVEARQGLEMGGRGRGMGCSRPCMVVVRAAPSPPCTSLIMHEHH